MIATARENLKDSTIGSFLRNPQHDLGALLSFRGHKRRCHLIDHQATFENADARLARGFLEIHPRECEHGAT